MVSTDGANGEPCGELCIATGKANKTPQLVGQQATTGVWWQVQDKQECRCGDKKPNLLAARGTNWEGGKLAVS